MKTDFDIWSDKVEFLDEIEKLNPSVLPDSAEEREVSEEAGYFDNESDLPEVRSKEAFFRWDPSFPEVLQIITQVNILDLPGGSDLKVVDSFSNSLAKVNSFSVELDKNSAFVIRHALKKLKITFEDPSIKSKVASLSKEAEEFKLWLDEEKKFIYLTFPDLDSYRRMAKSIGCFPQKSGLWRVQSNKVMFVERILSNLNLPYPDPKISEDIEALLNDPIPGYDETTESLKSIEIDSLNVISGNFQFDKGSEKSLAERMESFDLGTLYNLMLDVPRRFIDKTNPQDSLKGLLNKEPVTVLGKIAGISFIQDGTTPVFSIRISDKATVKANFWRQRWLAEKFLVGEEVLVTGKINYFRNDVSINGGIIEHSDEAAALEIVPIYNQSGTKGVNTDLIMKSSYEMFSRMKDLKLPTYLSQYRDLSYFDTYKSLHFPKKIEDFNEAIDTLAFYELVYMQIALKSAKKPLESETGIPMAKNSDSCYQVTLAKSLPYSLTGDQKRAIRELNETFESDDPSSTMLIADVGSGKTVISQLMAMRSAEAGYQSIVVAPTEILARQIYDSTVSLLENAGIDLRVDFLVGSRKAKERKEVIKGIESGETSIAIGTTSLLSESIKYSNLGFVCYDEQQKFGTAQRSDILKRRDDGRIPHVLMQSATPIPRSIAQSAYGDMDIIILEDKPAGRLPIETEWVQIDPNEFIRSTMLPEWNDILSEIRRGKQLFIVNPLVEESETIDAASVKETHKTLTSGILSSYNVAMIHGRMSSEDVKEVMADFRAKKYQAVVASSIVEVGVDIPDATRMVILSADRMGASSLHQIRGRIGRNSEQSICYLVSEGLNERSAERIQALVDNSDGFKIAEYDLQARGEGMMFGRNQSGGSSMKFASVLRNHEMIPSAIETAEKILESEHAEEAIKDSQIMFGNGRRI